MPNSMGRTVLASTTTDRKDEQLLIPFFGLARPQKGSGGDLNVTKLTDHLCHVRIGQLP